MRLTFISVLTVAAALAAGLQSASAVHNARYCTRGSTTHCAFNTWDQCMASARGHHSHCVVNPRWRASR